MKLISWNVNGLRACLNKGFLEAVNTLNPDILCLQETKMEQGQALIDLPDYHEYWNSAQKKGYSGTAVFTKEQPLSVHYGMGMEEHDQEGRIIRLEYPRFYLVNVYTPNSQRGLMRLDYRMRWEDDFRAHLTALSATKPVIVCGDLNVAHQEIDLKNPASNRRNAGFTDEERQKMTELLASGFVDTFRTLYPDRRDIYSWWSYMGGARARNVGWRIDYFLASTALIPLIKEAAIHDDIMGSDHCPVELQIAL
jgi:exodeoxyribonuclease-3